MHVACRAQAPPSFALHVQRVVGWGWGLELAHAIRMQRGAPWAQVSPSGGLSPFRLSCPHLTRKLMAEAPEKKNTMPLSEKATQLCTAAPSVS